MLRLAPVILPAGPLGFIPRPLQTTLPLPLDLGALAVERLAERQQSLELDRADHGQERRADRPIDMLEGQALADRLPVALPARDAAVAGARGAVVDLHPTAAAPANDDPLQQGTARPGRPPAGRELAGVVAQHRSIGQIPFPTDVRGVVVLQQDLAGVEREPATRPRGTQAQRAALAPPPVGVGPRVDRIAQDEMDSLVGRLGPDQLAVAGAA